MSVNTRETLPSLRARVETLEAKIDSLYDLVDELLGTFQRILNEVPPTLPNHPSPTGEKGDPQ